MRGSLIEGEQPTQLARVLAAADSGNGVSRELDFAYLFINTELTVHLQRLPIGEWVCLDARTRMDADGIGVASTALFDERSRFGSGAQSLFIAKR